MEEKQIWTIQRYYLKLELKQFENDVKSIILALNKFGDMSSFSSLKWCNDYETKIINFYDELNRMHKILKGEVPFPQGTTMRSTKNGWNNFLI